MAVPEKNIAGRIWEDYIEIVRLLISENPITAVAVINIFPL